MMLVVMLIQLVLLGMPGRMPLQMIQMLLQLLMM